MGKVQGVNSGYDEGPAAVVGGVPTKTRKLTNHFFAGPDYSVIHPGIFPHNVRAAEFKTLREWLQFDYKAGWGTDAFEDNLADDTVFPDAWFSIDDNDLSSKSSFSMLGQLIALQAGGVKSREAVLTIGVGGDAGVGAAGAVNTAVP